MKNLIYFLIFSLLPISTFSQKNITEWTVVATYEIPGKASGLTFDGSFLYSGLYSAPGDDNLIYKIDPTDGSYELQCIAPQEKSYGLTYDGTYFWSTDRQGSYDPALAVQFNEDGNLLSSFELPATYISGIEYMSDGTFWVCAYYDPNGTAFHIDANGNILGEFATPNDQPWAICQMDEQFWIADYDANMLYLVDETGQVMESHESIGINPTGVVYDGQYLWYITGPSQNPSTLYKVNLGGSGNPELDIQPQEINIGAVLVNGNQEFQLDFINSGGSIGTFNTETLSGTGTNIVDLNNLPTQINVDADDTETVVPDFDFISPGYFDLIQVFSTNDPLHTEIGVHVFGEIAYEGPKIQANTDMINFTDIRKFSTSRKWVEIVNTGNASLSISNITYENNSFYTDEPINFPINIESLDTLKLGVWFSPQNTGDFSSNLSIYSNDVGSPLHIDIAANAIDYAYGIGSELWNFQITTGYDQSPKAMLAIRDVSGDNIGDLFVCSEDNIIRCLNGNSSGTADELWRTEVYSGNVYQQNAIDNHQDIDGDGYEDFVVGTVGGDRSVICFSGKTGDILWKYQTNEYGDGGWVYQVYSQMDFNDDGIRDVLAAAGDDSYDTGPKGIILIDGLSGQKIWRAALNGPAFSVIGVVDFNGDNIPDVIGGASNEDETEGRVYGINGANGQTIWNFSTNGTSVWALAPLGDINNDGIPDIMAGDFSGYYYFLNASNGEELESGNIGNVLILRFLELDDINDDGFMDIAIANSSSTTYLINGYNGNAVWTAGLNDKSWNLAISNDLNSDGINDLLAGTLYSSNYSYFLDGSNGEELSKKAANIAIDALISIDDICRDYSMEMVVGDRNGKLICYSGGLDASVATKEINSVQGESYLTIAPNPITEETIINIIWPNEENVSIEIIEIASGKLVITKNIKLIKGEQQIKLPINTILKNNINSGLYMLKISSISSQQYGKFIYLK